MIDCAGLLASNLFCMLVCILPEFLPIEDILEFTLTFLRRLVDPFGRISVKVGLSSSSNVIWASYCWSCIVGLPLSASRPSSYISFFAPNFICSNYFRVSSLRSLRSDSLGFRRIFLDLWTSSGDCILLTRWYVIWVTVGGLLAKDLASSCYSLSITSY